MTILLPVRLPHTRLPITRRPGAVARILPVLAASLALAVGAESAQASAPSVPAASDTLRVTLSAPDGGTVAEGATGHFEVSVAGSTAAGAVKVQYSVSGTAQAGEDYTALSGETTVARGESVAGIALEALEDGILDKGETVVLTLTGATGPGTVLVDQRAVTATIADNGTVKVSLTAVPDTIGEGSSWRSTMTMSTPVADRISVRWWTTDGTAVAGRDYAAADEVVSFQPGETSKPIGVRTLEDDNTEAVEVFYVTLGLPYSSARTETEGAVNVDPTPQSAFIECSVVFPPPFPKVFEFAKPVEAGKVIGTVAANTTDGIPYYELEGGDNKFTINSLTAEISTTARLDPDLYELEVTVHDECGAEASVDVNVVVKQPNRSPTREGTIPPVTIKEGERGMVDVADYFSDPDEDPLTYTVGSSDATTVGVSVDGSEVTYKGLKAGSATVTVTATDSGNLSAEQTFTVTVIAPNRSPKPKGTIPDDSFTVGQSRSVDVLSKFDDPDGDTLTYAVESSKSTVLGVSVSDSDVTYEGLKAGSTTVTVTATDPGGLSAEQRFTVTVLAPECAISVEDGTFTVKEDATDVGPVGVTPNHCGDLEYVLTGAGAEDVSVAAVSGSNPNAKITGDFDFERRSSYGLTLTVSEEGGAASASGSVIITVLNVNEPPVVDVLIGDLMLYVGEGTTQEVIVLSTVFSDPDDDNLGYTAVSSNPAVATATVSGSTLTVTATGKGETMVTVTATDPGRLTAVDEFDVDVPNRAPEVENALADLTLYVGDGPNEKKIEIAGVFSDPDGDVLGYAVQSSDTDVATAVLSGTKLTVTATGKGRATVTLTADDGMGGTKAHEFEVRVPNRRPTAEGTIRDRAVEVGESRSVDVKQYFRDPDGDDLTYTSTLSDANKLTVNASGNPVRFTGVAEGSSRVTVTARDGGGLTATQQFDVEVYEPRPCTITVEDAVLSVAENAGVGTPVSDVVEVTASDCGTLSYALSGTGSGDFSVSAAGANDDNAKIRVKRALNHEGRDTYNLRLTVSWGSVSHARNVDISVTDVNEAPRPHGTIGRQTVRVGLPGSLNVTGYFTDEDAGDRLTFTSESSATGRLTVSGSGSPVTLTGVAAGSATVTVTARDRGGLTATQTFPVTVEPAPIPCGITVSDGALSVPEDAGVGTAVNGKVGVTTTGTCGTLGYALSGTGSGDFSVSAAGANDDDGKIRVKRGLNHEGRDAYDLTLTVSEVGGAATGAGDVDITVTDVNEAPKPKGAIDRQKIRIGRPDSVDVTGYFTDEDAGDRLTFTSESSATGRLTVNASGSPVTLTGVALGNATVTVTARDRGGLTATQTFSVTVDPAPTEPCGITVSDASLSVPEDVGIGDGVDGKVGVTTTGDCGTLGYALSGTGSADFTVAVAGSSDDDAKIGVAKALDHETKASYALTLTVSWGSVSDEGAVGISVTDVNDAPEVVGAIPALTVNSGDSKVVDVSGHFSDPDDDALTYEAESANEAATVKVSGGEVTVTGVSPGESRVTVTARDGRGGSASQDFTVTVENEAPEVVSAIPALTVGAGSSKVVDVSSHFSDPNGDALTYEAESSNSAATVAVSGSEVTVTGVSEGESELTVTARDTHGATVSQGFTVTVGPENDPPEIESAIPALTVAAGKTAVVEVSAHFSDPDGDALSYGAESSDDAVATVAAGGSEVTVTGVSRGASRVTVTARDGRGGSVSQDFAVTVPNRAPEAVGTLGGVSVFRYDRATVDVSGAFSDPDNDALTYRAVTSAAGVVALSVNGSRVTVRGVSRDTLTVTVTADDGHGGTAEQSYGVEVANRPPVPVAPFSPRTIAPGERHTESLEHRFRDLDEDPMTYTVDASPSWVADVSIEGLNLVIVGVARGRANVNVHAHDGHGGTTTHSPLKLTVTNGAPSFEDEAYEREVPENAAAGTAVGDPVTATDGDRDVLTYAFAAGGDEALFKIDAASGQIAVAEGADLDYESGDTVYTVGVRASDRSLADTASVTIRVTDVPAPGKPDAPVVTGGTEEVAVSWSAPSNEGPAITDYGLRYRAKADSDWTDVPALGAVLAHTIAGLEPGTTYSVQVRAQSAEGAGEWSESGEGTAMAANKAPSFDAATYEREVAENSAGGTAVGAPVTATDDDGDDLAYSFLAGGDEALFTIDAASGQISVAEGAALDYESGTTVYTVSVRASDGTLAATAGVTIRVTDVPAPGKPDAPVVTGGTEEVAVSWSAPSNEGPAITDYDLRYRAKTDSEWTDVSALGAVSAHTITDLNGGTTYQVQVRAVSSEGAGAWSEPGEGTAMAANKAPAFDAATYEREVPENSAAGTKVGQPVKATDEDDDELTYSFVPGGDEVSFEIDSATGQISVAEGAALDYESGNTVYTVSVRASDGTLAATAAVTIRVTDVPAPGKPAAPVVTGGTEEVAVSWSAPANDGPEITDYDLRYRAKAESQWTDVSALGAVLVHTITGLEGGTTYQVQVRAESSEGAGAWSEPGEGTAEAANKAPSFDADAYERSVPENSVPGTAVGEPVKATDDDDDDLAYSLLSGGDDAPFEIDAASGQISVAEGAALDYESGNTVYTLSVRASDGTLAATAAVTIRVTDVPAPGKPDAPVVTGGTEAVAAAWSAPTNDGPAITGYHLRHRAKSGSEWTAPTALGVVLAHTITGLEAGTAYQVQVRAESSEGAGAWSEPGEGTTEAANRAPSFDADAYEREVAENSVPGTAVGEPVTATDDGDELAYRFVAGGEAPVEIDGTTGRIAVAEGAALNYESGNTQFTVSVEASDGELADTASVTIRVTNADDPGVLTLSPEVARVGVELTAALTDEDGVRSAGRKRRWQRSTDGTSWNDIGTGRMYNPVTGDAGRWLRAVFTYADRHGPGKRAVSGAVRVLAANAAPDFGADAFEREVPENSPGGTKVGKPVTATDEDGDDLAYSLLAGDDAPFGIDAATGRITVAEDAALNYESGDTRFTVLVEASDGELADTASVTIRVTDADDPGKVALSPEVARVGVELTAVLMDEDGARDAGRRRRWQRSAGGNSWNDIGTGRTYTPVAADMGRWLRAVFTYTDGHGPGKRAVSAAVKVLAANTAPSFAAAYEREVPENSPGGTTVGAPVAATDTDSPTLSYAFAAGEDEALFGIGESTGQITVAAGAALDYESGDTLYTVLVEASDGELADTASVTIRVTNADDPGRITLSADVARVGVRLTATLMDQDRSIERSKMRTWQRSPDGAAWTMVVQGAARRFYTPTAADRGMFLRAVFTYADGHGPGKRAESPSVTVVGASTPVVSFGADSYTAAPGGSADVAVLLSPAASSALAIEVVAGDAAHTVTFQTGASAGTLAVSTVGLTASDTLAVRFGDLPDGVAVGVPATTRVVVAATAGDRASRSVVDGATPTELEVEYAHAEYSAVAGGPGTEITLRVSPAADRRVAVPLTVGQAISPEPAVPDSVVFEPGDSLAAFMLDVPAGTEPGLLALGFGTLSEAVSAGTVASATVDIAANTGALRDEAFEVGLAVLGRAVAEGARQAIGARIDAVMRPTGGGSGTAAPGSAAEWAGRVAGTLASLTGAPLNASSAADMNRRSGSVDLPNGRDAVRRLLPSVSFATSLGPQSPRGLPRLGLWAEGSTQSFRGEPGIDYDGGLRALTVGADARIGSSALLGVSLMRSDGNLDYGNRSVEGSLGHAMNSVHPYLFLQPSPRIGLWAMAGYGTGDVADDDRHGDTGASLRMLSGGVKVPLARRGAFGLALNGDAFTVGMSTEGGEREGSASRARALLEASWTAGGLTLATQAGARYDAGDADTGGGAETGASIGYAAHGLDFDLRGRLALGSGRHREWGAALRLAFDPGTRGEGLRLSVSPRHGHDRNGIHGLMDGGTLQMMTPIAGRHGQDWRLDAEAGYGLKNPGGGALDSYTRLSADGRSRSWSFGTRYNVSRTLRLGIEGSRRQMAGQHPNLGVKLALDLAF